MVELAAMRSNRESVRLSVELEEEGLMMGESMMYVQPGSVLPIVLVSTVISDDKSALFVLV